MMITLSNIYVRSKEMPISNSVTSLKIVPLVQLPNGVDGVHLLRNVFLEILNMLSVHRIVSLAGSLIN